MQVKDRTLEADAARPQTRQGTLGRLRRTYEEKRWFRVAVFSVIAVVCAAFFYAFNAQTALLADDFDYRFVFGLENQRVETLGDLLFSMRNHYRTMNGRVVLHFLTQLFLLWGKPVFNLVNTVGYLLFTGLVYWHCKGTGRHNPALFFGVHLMVFFLIPMYGQTMLWLDGSANYMWGSILRLAVLLPFRLYAQQWGGAGSWRWLFLAVPAGFLAGWTNENASAALIGMMVLFCFYFKGTGRKTPGWSLGALAGALAGFAFMICAPGNRVRVENNFGELGLSFERLWSGLLVCNRKVYYYVLPILALFAGSLLLLHFFGAEERRAKRLRCLLGGVYLAGSLAGVYAMLPVPFFPSRAMFGPVVCALTAVGTVFAGVRLDKAVLRRACAVVFAGCMLAAGVTYAGAYAANARAYGQLQAREAYIAREKAAGRFDVAVDEVRVLGNSYSPYYGLDDVAPDPRQWANAAKARYYGLHSIRLKE